MKKGDLSLAGIGGILTFIGDIVRILLELTVQVVIARFAGPSIMGLYAIGLTITNIVRTISQIGFDKTILRYIGVYQTKNDEKSMKGLIYLSFLIPLILGSIGGFILYILSSYIGVNILHKPELVHYLRLFAFSTPFLSCLYVMYNGFIGLRKPHLFVILRSIIYPGLVLFMVAFFLFTGHTEFGPVQGFLIASIISSILAFWLLNKTYHFTKGPKNYNMKTHLNYSFFAMLVSLSFFLQHRIDVVVAGYFTTSEQTGIYYVSARLPLLLLIPLDAFTQVASTSFARMHERRDKKEMERLYRATTRWALYITTPIIISFCLFPEIFLNIFGPEFVKGKIIVVLMSIFFFIRLLVGPVGNILMMSGYQKLELMNVVAMFALYLPLTFLLAPWFKGSWCSMSYSIAILSVNILRAVELYVLNRIHPFSRSIYKVFSSAGISFLIMLGVKYTLSQWLSPIHVAIFAIVCGVLIFILISSLLGFEQEEKVLIEGMIRYINKRWISV